MKLVNLLMIFYLLWGLPAIADDHHAGELVGEPISCSADHLQSDNLADEYLSAHSSADRLMKFYSWISGIVMGVCGLAIAVVGAITIKENYAYAVRSKRLHADIQAEAENLKGQMRSKCAALEEEIISDSKRRMDMMVRAFRVRMYLDSGDDINEDEIYDDIRNLCLRPEAAYAPLYLMIAGRVSDLDLVFFAEKALKVAESEMSEK